MTTLTLNVPDTSIKKYKEIFNYFIVNYDIKELGEIKNDIEMSKKLYKDYNDDFEGQKDIGIINTDLKNKREILSELDDTLWN